MRTGRRFVLRSLAALVVGTGAARADDPAPAPPAAPAASRVTWSSLFDSSAFTLYTENDKYFAGTDRHYTNGFKLSFLGDTTLDHSPGFVKEVAKYIPSLPLELAEQQHYKVGVSLGQNIYTPTNIHTPTPDPTDRPYAAWLYNGLFFQASHRDDSPGAHDLLRMVELDLGVVGPAAIGKQIQNGVHTIIGVPHAEGWSHQLHNEPGAIFSWERRYRLYLTPKQDSGLGGDLIGHGGVSLGNVDTSARAGLLLRAGWKLPRDFGPNLIRSAGEDTCPADGSFYFFGGAEARAVGRNIFLDGNTWESSPSVRKRPLVADFNVGFVCRLPCHVGRLCGFQLAYSENYRTKEFYGQLQRDVFGSIALSLLY